MEELRLVEEAIDRAVNNLLDEISLQVMLEDGTGHMDANANLVDEEEGQPEVHKVADSVATDLGLTDAAAASASAPTCPALGEDLGLPKSRGVGEVANA